MKIVILGGGFASLKIATLISHSLKIEKDHVTLISDSKKFIFLPLMPNFLDKSLNNGMSDIVVDLKEFCSSRGVNFINHPILEQDIRPDHLIVQGNNVAYDLLFDGRGKVNDQNRNTYKYWEMFIESIESCPLKKDLFFEKPGIAEYEIIQALKSSSTNIDVHFEQSKRSFSSHPQLKNILNLKSKSKIIGQLPKGIDIDKNVIIRGKKVLLGGALAHELNCESTAQFASFSAKVGYKLYALHKKHLSCDRTNKLNIKSFRQRGKMLYVNKGNAYIWLGEDFGMSINPHFKGKLGYLIRKLFYVRQMRLFYSEKTCRRAIWAYKLFLNTFQIVRT